MDEKKKTTGSKTTLADTPSKPDPVRQSFMKWANSEKVVNLANGAAVRFDIDHKEKMTLQEFLHTAEVDGLNQIFWCAR